MFSRILVPVDLGHLDRLEKALHVAADLARHYRLPVVYVGVTGTVPDQIARTPGEFADKLKGFAEHQAETQGIEASAHALSSPDPQAELDRLLRKAVETLGADLVVMASHSPSWLDWLLPSHGGSVAEHSEASVFVVR
ncbi:universal stress protein [Rhodovulum sp.]|uniref:universal stress protein n=1 Tax=Rhodovulum sp. TaxID=34009 RepID=UPI0018344E52|nr:universal stress protein [Rhodovulum sp.]HDR29547.1 universal stress protein [Rhodovulum sp.]